MGKGARIFPARFPIDFVFENRNMCEKISLENFANPKMDPPSVEVPFPSSESLGTSEVGPVEHLLIKLFLIMHNA